MTPDVVVPLPSQFEPAESFVDPRSQPGYQAGHWPRCNDGESPPVGASDRHARRCIEFLAAYYEVNCRQAELAAARSADAAELQQRVAAVAAALEAVDRLEDRYAPVGFYGEPTMSGTFYASIAFHRPELPRILSQASAQSSHIAIPGLEEIAPDELRGPTVITRWRHGKVDL